MVVPWLTCLHNDSQPCSSPSRKTQSRTAAGFEHGVRENDAAPGTPLLVIAGAGKTNTLAHRVAHLNRQCANSRKILLMNFSRRAAAEMARRVERIARRVIGDREPLRGGLDEFFSRPAVWFAVDETRPLAFLAGIWTRWTSIGK